MVFELDEGWPMSTTDVTEYTRNTNWEPINTFALSKPLITITCETDDLRNKTINFREKIKWTVDIC